MKEPRCVWSQHSIFTEWETERQTDRQIYTLDLIHRPASGAFVSNDAINVFGQWFTFQCRTHVYMKFLLLWAKMHFIFNEFSQWILKKSVHGSQYIYYTTLLQWHWMPSKRAYAPANFHVHLRVWNGLRLEAFLHTKKRKENSVCSAIEIRITCASCRISSAILFGFFNCYMNIPTYFVPSLDSSQFSLSRSRSVSFSISFYTCVRIILISWNLFPLFFVYFFFSPISLCTRAHLNMFSLFFFGGRVYVYHHHHHYHQKCKTSVKTFRFRVCVCCARLAHKSLTKSSKTWNGRLSCRGGTPSNHIDKPSKHATSNRLSFTKQVALLLALLIFFRLSFSRFNLRCFFSLLLFSLIGFPFECAINLFFFPFLFFFFNSFVWKWSIFDWFLQNWQ